MMMENDHPQQERVTGWALKIDVTVDTREVYLLILLFLSNGPCQKAFKQLWMELSEYDLLPRRYHAWHSRSGEHSGIYDDDGLSVPLAYDKLVERYPHIEKDHLVKLLKQTLLNIAVPRHPKVGEDPPNAANAPPDATYASPNAADAPTLLGFGSFSLLNGNTCMDKHFTALPAYMRGPHSQANPVHAISSREIGGGFAKHHRAPSIRSTCYVIAKPSTIVQRIDQVTKLRGHRNAVYCAIFDPSGRYVITGSDDRLVKIWSMETAFCLASCRGHEGDITDLAVSSNGVLVASASNDFIIRVWRLPDGIPISVLRGHTGAVTAITFSPRPSCQYHLLSSSDDGSCRIWDARNSQNGPRIYLPKPTVPLSGIGTIPPSSGSSFPPQSNRVLWCAYNANGTTFVTGSSDTFARVWRACVSSTDQSDQPVHEIDTLSGHENDVNYVQFSGCAVASSFSNMEVLKEDNFPKLRNPWFCHDYIVTCSRDGSAIIWSPRSRKSNGQPVRWSKLYQMKVPGPQLPPRPPRGGPRQRILPTPRGVNMIIWSLDNRFVLAAIMDCRICIWDAENGSLVHTLIGHTASSYVLDVHPFNPKIAMSAGYDGSAKIWDIWEGILLRTYEVGPFKLVDGKFSPDGTSIVLSDDVGHLHLINTGQGEALSDAKYDQFFLGDFRPLVHDSAGNALDQETQLLPHRRNMQDPLCDSSMMPYPEPYQTSFQKRRLGILGVEWRPSSRPFVAHSDFSLGQDYQMPPLEDWDRLIEPVPQFADIMNWEPENEVVHDDTDSEYNAAEEFTSEDQRGSFSDSSSSHPCSSAEDSDVNRRQKNIVRRSRRKHKPEVPMTASGKQVKKRNSGDCDAQISESNKAKKLRTGRKVVKRKNFKSKTFQPQRAAARNAQDKLYREAGMSSNGDDVDVSEDDTSSGESELQYPNISEGNLQDMQKKKEMASEAEDMFQYPQSHSTMSGSRKIILKIPLHSRKRSVPYERDNLFGENLGSYMKTSTGLLQGIKMSPKDPGSSSTGVCCVKPLPNHIHIAGMGTDGASCSSSREDIPVDAPMGFQIDFDSQKEEKNHLCWEGNPLQATALKDQDALMGKNMTPDRICRPLLVSSSRQVHMASEPNALAGSSGQILDIEDRASHLSDQGYLADLPATNKLDQPKHSQNLKQNLQPANHRIKFKIKTLSPESGIPELNFTNVVVPLKYPYHLPTTDPHEVVEDSRVSHAVKADSTCQGIGHPDSAAGSSKAPSLLPCRTRSMKAISKELNVGNNIFTVNVVHGLASVSENVGNHSVSERMPNSESPGSSSRCSQDLYSGYDLTSTKGRNARPPKRKLSWLILSKHEEGDRYIPQLGDEVVYLRQGHQEYIEANPARHRGPWTYIKGLKAVEICRIENLEYDTVPGSGDSCCKMQLRVVDPSSIALGKTFLLTLTELIDFPDFVVEKKRFDAAINRNWAQNEMCRVWWRNENGEGGDWWEGWIRTIKAKSPQFPDSPWERFTVQYGNDTNKDYRHSPWELQDLDIEWEHPQIDSQIRDKLLSLFNRFQQSDGGHQDRYGVRKLNEAFNKFDFFNRFPVPLCPEVIHARLENNYYRTVEAVEHDIQVMLKNAHLYFQNNCELLSKIRRLSDWFQRKLSKL